MDSYEGEKYYCNSTNVYETINKYGVAIIPKLISDIECNNMINGMFDYLKYITNNKINKNENTWKYYFNLYPTQSMILQFWGIGHAQYIWDLRQNKKNYRYLF